MVDISRNKYSFEYHNIRQIIVYQERKLFMIICELLEFIQVFHIEAKFDSFLL